MGELGWLEVVLPCSLCCCSSWPPLPLPLGGEGEGHILLLLPQGDCHEEPCLAKRAKDLYFLLGSAIFHKMAKRSPEPEAQPGPNGAGVSLSLTANMDTLRQRLMFAMRNRNSQGGGRDLGLAG